MQSMAIKASAPCSELRNVWCTKLDFKDVFKMISLYTCMGLCTHGWHACRGRRESLNPLGLELQGVVRAQHGCWEPNSNPLPLKLLKVSIAWIKLCHVSIWVFQRKWRKNIWIYLVSRVNCLRHYVSQFMLI